MAERPRFLDLLDQAPESGKESFWGFVRAFFRESPPYVYFAVRPD